MFGHRLFSLSLRDIDRLIQRILPRLLDRSASISADGETVSVLGMPLRGRRWRLLPPYCFGAARTNSVASLTGDQPQSHNHSSRINAGVNQILAALRAVPAVLCQRPAERQVGAALLPPSQKNQFFSVGRSTNQIGGIGGSPDQPQAKDDPKVARDAESPPAANLAALAGRGGHRIEAESAARESSGPNRSRISGRKLQRKQRFLCVRWRKVG